VLKKIRIEGFKSIKNQEIELKPLNVLIGANGSGKSNFIKAFEFLNKVVKKELQDYVAQRGAGSFLYFGTKNTFKINFELEFGNKNKINDNTYKLSLTPRTDDKIVIGQEYCKYKNITEILAENGDKESKMLEKNERICKYTYACLKNIKVYHFEDTTDQSPLKQTCNVELNTSLESNGNNLPAILYRLKTSKNENYNFSYQKIAQTINLVAPFFKDFVLEPNESNNIRLRWKHSRNNEIFDVSSFSDGTLRFIAITTLLLLPSELIPNIVIIDEPELGLHPMAIKVITELAQSLARQDKQLILSSQSITFINQFASEDLIVVDKKIDTTNENNEESVFKRISEDDVKEWIEDFSIGDIWNMNIIGGRPNNYE